MSPAVAATLRRRLNLLLGHVLQLFIASLLGGLLYLSTIGLPQPWVERITDQIEGSGIAVSIQRIRYVPPWGIVLRDTRVFLSAADQYPAVTADEVLIQFRLRDLIRREWLSARIFIKDAEANVNLVEPLRDLHAPEVLRVDLFYSALELAPDQVTVHALRGELRGLQLYAEGVAQWASRPVEPGPRQRIDQQWETWREEPPAGVATAIRELKSLQFGDESVASLDLALDWNAEERVRLSSAGSIQALSYQGLRFDQARYELTISNRVVDVSLLQLLADNERLEASARFDWGEDHAEAYIFSDLRPVYWRNLLPTVVREPMERFRINAFGATEVELVIGPSAWEKLGQGVRGRINAESIEAHGVWMDSFQANVLRIGPSVEVFEIDAVLGQNKGQGPARGHATFNLDDGTYYGEVVASFDPQVVLPVAGYSRIAAEIIQQIAFDETLPEIDVAFSGNVFDDPLFHFSGDIRGQDFVYAGSRIDSFDSTFQVSNRVMRIEPLLATRPEGQVEGWYQMDFNNQWIDLDVSSSIDPRALGRIAGGAVERILRAFRFEGPVTVDLAGRVDYGQHKETDYVAIGQGENVGWRWLIADHCSLEWIAKGDAILLTNLTASLYGGTLEGVVEMTRVGGDDSVQYWTDGSVSGVSFAALTRDLRQVETELQRGDLSGRFTLEGAAESDWRASLTGEGRVRIQDGEIFQIRLFGGLSELLGRVYPRLGFAVQSDVRSEFTIAERKISSDEIRLTGNIISLRGWGNYHLDDRLDFTVQVQPLRRGFLVDAVRFVTYPVSRLLQFSLDGTLSEPQWRMDPLPRDRNQRE